MRLQYHVAISTLIAGVLHLFFKSWAVTISCFMTGIFIDLDHFIDYFREKGWRLNIRDFFETCHTGQFERIMLLWHGWEWMALLGISAWLSHWNPWITGAFIGYGQHMIVDALSNSNTVKSYSLFWKWKNNFYFDTIFPNLKQLKYKYRYR